MSRVSPAPCSGAAFAAVASRVRQRRDHRGLRYAVLCSARVLGTRPRPAKAERRRISEAADGSTIVSDSAPLRIVGGSIRSTAAGSAAAASSSVLRTSGPAASSSATATTRSATAPRRTSSLPRFGGGLDAGAGNDTIFAGIRRNAVGTLFILGGSGTADKVRTPAPRPARRSRSTASPRTTSSPVTAATMSSPASRPVEGSSFGDRSTAANASHRERFTGGLGLDDPQRRERSRRVRNEGPVAKPAPTTSTARAAIDRVDIIRSAPRA